MSRAVLVWLVLGWVGCAAPDTPVEPGDAGTETTVFPPRAERTFTDVHEQALWAANRIDSELDCTANMVRYLCAARGVVTAGFRAPAEPRVLLGLTVLIRDHRPIEATAMESASASVLHVGPASLAVRSLAGSSSSEMRELMGLVSNISMVLKGKENKVVVSQSLEDFVFDDTGIFKHSLTTDELGGTFDNGNMGRVYTVSSPTGAALVYVVVESGPRGLFLSIFPDVPYRVR